MWTLSTLESRLMLAGDLGVAESSASVANQVSMPVAPVVQSSALVFVDPTVPHVQQVVAKIQHTHEMVLLDSSRCGVDQITEALRGRTNIQSVHIIAHGDVGQIKIGNQVVDQQTLIHLQTSVRQWGASLATQADILLYSCKTGEGAIGKQFITHLARLTGADVAASIDNTGSRSDGGDWELELVSGAIETPLVFDSQFRDRYRGTLAITILAAGVEGDEQMQLLIGGTAVQTWTVGGDAYGGQFETFTFDQEGFNANDVRIAFLNDLYDPANSRDRNLRVDQISIDGTVFQTESPAVYSTGTWRPGGIGVVPGFLQNEYLHTNGYFQYAGNSTDNGSLVAINVIGEEGDENISLIIDGQTVQSWTAIGTANRTFIYQANSTVHASQVRVAFTNDLYDVPNGIDRNVRVDRITIDGTNYESEAPNVFSTGTWLPGSGVTPGFRQSESLHTNGYFHYNQGNPGQIGLTLESLTIDEDLGTLNFVVFRTGGTAGTVTVNYSTELGTAQLSDLTPISGTLTFADGVESQQLSLNILNDNVEETNESFTLRLTDPTGGAALGPITSQVVTIRDDDEVIDGIVFQDSFETASNWTTNPQATDTATGGAWQIGSAQQTTSNGTTIQFGSGSTGPGALVTGLAAGSSVGAFDVDNGLTSVVSRPIDLPNAPEIKLSFAYNFAYLANATSDDYFAAYVIANGATTEIIQDHAHNTLLAANWQIVSFDLSPFAGQSIQIMFQAADLVGGSLIEAAVDDVVIEVLPNLPGTISIETTGVNVDEAAGTATVVVRRSSGRNGTVTVDYATVLGSATTDDYVPATGTLTFGHGQAEQSVTISILNDTIVEPLESFGFVLSNPTGDAVIGVDNAASITIVDNDNAGVDYRPDLTPIASTLTERLSIDTTELPGRQLLRFSAEIANAGQGPLEIWGGSTSGSSQQVFQRIYQEGGGHRDVMAGEFVYHANHGHVHFDGFATYDLKLTDATRNIVASGGKTSFCLINLRQPLPDVTANAGRVHGRGGNSCGQIQGISAGYSDVYSASLDDQWIDVTNVPNGQYWLEIATDPENRIVESNESNNTARVLIQLENGRVTF